MFRSYFRSWRPVRSTLSLAGLGLTALLAAQPVVAEPTLQSDDFSGCALDARWQIFDPVGDGSAIVTGAGTNLAHLELTVPDGTARDTWGVSGNSALRAMQAIDDPGDFEIEVAFVSVPGIGFNDQGLLIEQDADNFIRFDVYHTGSELRVFAGKTENGVNQIMVNGVIGSTDAQFLRAARSADVWTLSISPDGDDWTVVGTLTLPLSVTAAGVYVANPVTAIGYTAIVDYFFETTTPIANEDAAGAGCSCVDVDGDGYGEGDACLGPDCNDDDATVFPGAEETCNGVDDDCDGTIDDAFDADGDGQSFCAGDCDDGEPDSYTGNVETCDLTDNDCNGVADDGLSSLTVILNRNWEPLVGAPVRLYDRSLDSCARTECGRGGNDYACIAETCEPVTLADGLSAQAMTDDDGVARFDVAPGHYVAIGGDGTDRHLAATVGAIECGEHPVRRLQSSDKPRRKGQAASVGVDQP